MAVSGLLPIDNDEVFGNGKFLTFVVPAPDGCNLNCGFCFIKQRSRFVGSSLRPGHYSQFIREVYDWAPTYALAIQGYEPLLPGSRPYTEAVLRTGVELGLPVGLVTNGTYLHETAEWLAAFVPGKVAISLDAALAGVHDRLRGKEGAWASTIAGIEHAKKVFPLRTALAVASVLMPSGHTLLDGMPQLLRSLGVEEWIVTPLLDAGYGPVGCKRDLYRSFAYLQDAADSAGIRLIVDDELDCLQHKLACAKEPELARINVRAIPREIEIVRLEPGGECIVGMELMRAITEVTPRWRPDRQSGGSFLERLTSPVRRGQASGAKAFGLPRAAANRYWNFEQSGVGSRAANVE